MKFCFISAKDKTINNTNFIEISILELDKSVLSKIYKIRNSDIINRISHFKQFEDITSHISFDIRNNGKIVLDIK